MLLPIGFWPVGGRGRSRRATDSPALAPVGSDARGSNLAPTAIARSRNWHSDCVFVPLRSQVPTDRPAGLAGSARSAPKGGLFWRSGLLLGRATMSLNLTGSRRGAHRAGWNVPKFQTAWYAALKWVQKLIGVGVWCGRNPILHKRWDPVERSATWGLAF